MTRKEMVTGLFISVAIGALISPFASSFPDGLEKVAERIGFMEKGEGRQILGTPFFDYTIPGIANEKLSTSIAGGLGAGLLFAAGCGVAVILKRMKKKDA